MAAWFHALDDQEVRAPATEGEHEAQTEQDRVWLGNHLFYGPTGTETGTLSSIAKQESLPGTTNGRKEGINRKIKAMLRQFYGLRDDDLYTFNVQLSRMFLKRGSYSAFYQLSKDKSSSSGYTSFQPPSRLSNRDSH